MKRAFSLIELLVVIAIIGILAALIAPSLTSSLGSSKINLGVETVRGALSSARQIAATKNNDVEFRLITMKDPVWTLSSEQIRGIHILEMREDGPAMIGKARIFPSGVIISSSIDISSLAQLPEKTATTNDPKIPGMGNSYRYRSFRFRPDGSINLKGFLPNSVTNFFMTMYDEKFESEVSGNTPPANFATIKLQPDTGANTLYRP